MLSEGRLFVATSLSRRRKLSRSLATLGILGLLALSAAPAVAAPEEKIDICHATGSASNPFVSISVSLNGLNGHADHGSDIIPPNSVLPEGLNFDATGEGTYKNGCVPVVAPIQPPGQPEQPVQPAPEKIVICHATGSARNPFVSISISLSGLSGHAGHSGDIIPPNRVLPAGLNFDATGKATYGNGCIPVAAPTHLSGQPEGQVPPATPETSGLPETSGQVGQLGQPEVPEQSGQVGQAGQLGLGMPGQTGLTPMGESGQAQPGQPSGTAVATNQGLNVQTAAGGVESPDAVTLLLGGFVSSLVIAGLWAARRSVL